MLVSGVREPSGIQNTDVQIRPREECYSFGSERFAWPLFMSYVPVTRNEVLGMLRCIPMLHTIRSSSRTFAIT